MEAIQQTFNGTFGFDKRVTCQISRNGDLIHRIWLNLTLPKAASGNAVWADYIGLRCIKSVELEIGGQRIDKHYPEWMYIWNELSLPSGKKTGYRCLVNGVVAGASSSSYATTDTSTTVKLHVPLEFWFCRNVGLALPLIALQYHEVKINIEFESKTNVIRSGTVNDDLDGTLWVDYIFLDTDERRRFAQLSHEYLIEQLQFTGDETLTGATNRIKLNFNHPCKELIWVSPKVTLSSNDWTNFTLTTGSNVTDNAILQLNGQDRFAERTGDYFNLVQPFQHHENVSDNRGINVYSFALKPEEHQPSGSLNMSRIDTAVLSIKTTAASSLHKVKVYAVNYNVLRIMSGMGGLNRCIKLYVAYRAKKQWSAMKRALVAVKTLCSRKISQLLVGAPQTPRQHTLLIGKPLRASYTKVGSETFPLAKNKNLGMVKMMKIGQSACLLPKGAMLAYGRASETERVWVGDEGLSNLSRPKIQSIPLGKLRGTRVPIPTKLLQKISLSSRYYKNKTLLFLSLRWKYHTIIVYLLFLRSEITHIVLIQSTLYNVSE